MNVQGTFTVSQIVARGMVERGNGGAILTLSSLASMLGVQDHTAYCCSKGAVDSLTRMMALELGQFTRVCPPLYAHSRCLPMPGFAAT